MRDLKSLLAKYPEKTFTELLTRQYGSVSKTLFLKLEAGLAKIAVKTVPGQNSIVAIDIQNLMTRLDVFILENQAAIAQIDPAEFCELVVNTTIYPEAARGTLLLKGCKDVDILIPLLIGDCENSEGFVTAWEAVKYDVPTSKSNSSTSSTSSTATHQAGGGKSSSYHTWARPSSNPTGEYRESMAAHSETFVQSDDYDCDSCGAKGHDSRVCRQLCVRPGCRRGSHVAKHQNKDCHEELRRQEGRIDSRMGRNHQQQVANSVRRISSTSTHSEELQQAYLCGLQDAPQQNSFTARHAYRQQFEDEQQEASRQRWNVMRVPQHESEPGDFGHSVTPVSAQSDND